MKFIPLLSLKLCLFLGTPFPHSQVSASWLSPELPFRVLNLSSTGRVLWLCGTDEAIASSADNSAHWQVKHRTINGRVLLNINFADSRFGFAAGTSGLVLTTEDGGETWVPNAGLNETILQVAFADPEPGPIRTP